MTDPKLTRSKVTRSWRTGKWFRVRLVIWLAILLFLASVYAADRFIQLPIARINVDKAARLVDNSNFDDIEPKDLPEALQPLLGEAQLIGINELNLGAAELEKIDEEPQFIFRYEWKRIIPNDEPTVAYLFGNKSETRFVANRDLTVDDFVIDEFNLGKVPVDVVKGNIDKTVAAAIE